MLPGGGLVRIGAVMSLRRRYDHRLLNSTFASIFFLGLHSEFLTVYVRWIWRLWYTFIRVYGLHIFRSTEVSSLILV